MKKVISVATTAAMTLSALSVPAVICAAEQEVGLVQPSSYAIEDAKTTQGTGSFDVTVRATKTCDVQEGNINFKAELYYGGKFTAEVTDVKTEVEGLEVSNDGNMVSFTGSGHVTKGDVVAVITVSIDEATPQNALFSLTVAEADGDFAALLGTEAFLFVTEDTETADDASIVLGSKNAFVAEDEVEIPVTISGTYGTLVTKFAASNGAVVSGIEIAEEYDGIITVTDDEKGIAYLPKNVTDSNEITLDDAVVATIKVKLPADLCSGMSFKVSTRFFDGSNSEDEAVTPESTDADIIYVLKGDADLDNEVMLVDATYTLREYLNNSAKNETILSSIWNVNDEVEYTISTLTADKLTKAVKEAVSSESVDTIVPTDATYIVKYYLAVSGTGYEGTYADYLAEYVNK